MEMISIFQNIWRHKQLGTTGFLRSHALPPVSGYATPAHFLRNLTFVFLTVLLLPGVAAGQNGEPLTRTVLAFYNSNEFSDVRATRIHQLAEMPLNHLGLKVRYHDINQPLPTLAEMEGVRGILTWFQNDQMPNPANYVQWAVQAMNRGIRLVVFDDLGIQRNMQGADTPLATVNAYLKPLGLETDGIWKVTTYDVKLQRKLPQLVEFERPHQVPLPSFLQIKKLDENVTTYLEAHWGKARPSSSAIVTVNSMGGYVAAEYASFMDDTQVQWHINPFEFFRLAYATDDLPKPDVTTLSGRRIFYSHIDGDGWRNVTELEKYKNDRTLSSQVIYEEILSTYPDLPTTVSAIAGDIDLNWHGTEETRAIGKRIFALPQVEAASHTFSHPFAWQYFEDYRPENEWNDYLKDGIGKNKDIQANYQSFLKNAPPKKTQDNEALDYETPRAYGKFPYDLDQEISGAIDSINSLLPEGKNIRLVQWPGDTWIYEAALKKAADEGLRNINGGDSRLDPEYPSNGWVSPIGVQIGSERQIYASACNENNYTSYWTDKFFGFKHLQLTLKNTESPRRLKPMNIYYHMYSGQKHASLNAVRENLQFARRSEIAPITASRYAAIAEGFYSTKIVALGANKYRIEDRGELQTIRIDHAAAKTVDMTLSAGVMGQRHYQGSLYIALDASVKTPTITLKPHTMQETYPAAATPYMIQGRWNVWDLAFPSQSKTRFQAQGFGKGGMVWKMDGPGLYKIHLKGKDGTVQNIRSTANENGVLEFTFRSIGLNPVNILIERMEEVL